MIKLRYVRRDVDRYGTVRFYFQRRKRGQKTRMVAAPDTPEFFEQYHALLSQDVRRPGVAGLTPSTAPLAGTYRWLCVEYFRSAVFKRLDKRTQYVRRLILEGTLVEPVHEGAAETFAAFPLVRLTTKALRVLRDRKAGPEAGNNRVKALRAVFKWGLAEEHVTTNPARDLDKVKTGSTGFHTWTVEEVARFETRHEVGGKARLALALLMWTGVRRSDVVLLGRQHTRGGWLHFRAQKNKVAVEIPILPELQRVIEASHVGSMTYLVTEYGRPFTAAGFGNWFRERCREAGVPGSAHGLRKAGAVTAAENGATTHQLMSIFGWLTLAEAERYTREAQRKRMAGDAMGLLVRKPE
jgi:integrase